MAKDKRERIYGPYPDRNGWRVVAVDGNGRRATKQFATEAAAQRVVDDARAKTDSQTVNGAIDAYIEVQRAKGRRESSLATTEQRLRTTLEPGERTLRAITPTAASALWDRRCAECAGETQRGILGELQLWAAWCRARGWLDRDPFAGLAITKCRERGKPQLRIDEARKLLDAALGERSDEGLAIALALLTGLRASEITDRAVRDVDDGARVLWIDRAKTRHGIRRLEIPELMRAGMAALVAGRHGGEPLWRDPDRDRDWVYRHCRRLCGVAGVPVVPPHGLRGTWATLARAEVPTDAVARALGHGSTAVTERHYLDPDADHAASSSSVLRLIAGGSR